MKEASELPKAANLGRPDPVHPPRLPIVYGSLRKVSFSRFLAMEAARLLGTLGA
jgi:arsenical resistance protein ArsH